MNPVLFDRSLRSPSGIRGYRNRWHATFDGGPWANIGDYRSDLAVRDHYHPYLTVDTVINGRGVYRDRRGTRCCEPATLMVVDAGEVHDTCPIHCGMTILSIGAPSRWLTEAGLPTTTSNGTSIHPRLALRVFRLFDEIQIADSCSALAIEELVVHTLDDALGGATGSSQSRHPPPWLREVTARLHDEPSEAASLRTLAADVGVHFTHLARAFKAHLGCTIGEYQRMLRIQGSIRMLINSREPLAQVALEAGFCDQSHYHRCFQRLMGVAPGKFRRFVGQFVAG